MFALRRSITRALSSAALLSAPLIGAIGGADAAPTHHNVNASEIGTGVARGLSWSQEALETTIWCGSACSYMQVSAAKIAPDSLFTYGPATWPGSYVSSIPNLAAVAKSIPTPVGTTDSSGREIVYESSSYEKGSVEVTRVGDFLNTRVYQSGNQDSGGAGTAAAALAYHVKVQNQSSSGRDFFIRFVAPKPTGGVSIPYNIGGPSGQQPMYVSQKKYAKSRSAVDVLVNGLPVWSTSTSYVIPEETYSSNDYTGFPLDFGSASNDDSYTVFVGRFDSGVSFEVDFIVRAESLARAPTCGKVTEPATYPNPRVLMHCLLITENRELPNSINEPERFEIYSKVVSTAIYTLPGGGVLVPAAASSVALNSTKVQ